MMPEKKRNLAFLAFVLIAASAYYLFISQGNPTFRFSAEAGTFAFEGAHETRAAFSFDTLEALELREDPDYGACVRGGEAPGGVLYGTWQSGALGEYEAFVRKGIGACILARGGGKAAAFNTENAQTTAALYEQLYTFWQNARNGVSP